jgi:hypothetical protein
VATVGFSAEHTELDLLVISTLLRRQGIAVKPLGTDLEPQMLEHAINHFNVGAIIFYADDPKNALRLASLQNPFHSADKAVRVVICGHSLEIAPELRPHLSFEYLGSDLRTALIEMIRYIREETARSAISAGRAGD